MPVKRGQPCHCDPKVCSPHRRRAAQIDNLPTRLLHEVIRRADYELEILAVRIRFRQRSSLGRWTSVRAAGFSSLIQQSFVEHPLGGVVEQGEKRLGHHRAVVP